MNSKHTTDMRFPNQSIARLGRSALCVVLSLTLGWYVVMPAAALADEETKMGTLAENENSGDAAESDEASEEEPSDETDETASGEAQDEAEAEESEDETASSSGSSAASDDASGESEAEDDAAEAEGDASENDGDGSDLGEADDTDDAEIVAEEDDSDTGATRKKRTEPNTSKADSSNSAEADEEDEDEEARRKKEEEEEEKRKKEEEEKERDEKVREEIEKAQSDLDRANEAAAEILSLASDLDGYQDTFTAEGTEYARLSKMAKNAESALHQAEKHMDSVFALNSFAYRNVMLGNDGVCSAHVVEAIAQEQARESSERDVPEADDSFEPVSDDGANEEGADGDDSAGDEIEDVDEDATQDANPANRALEAVGVNNAIAEEPSANESNGSQAEDIPFIERVEPVAPANLVGEAAYAMAANMEAAAVQAQADVMASGSRYAQTSAWSKRQGEAARTAREEANDIAYAIDELCSDVKKYDREAIERLEGIDGEDVTENMEEELEDVLKETRDTISDHEDARKSAQERAGEWYDLLDSIGGVEATASFGVGYDFALDEETFVEKWGSAIDRYYTDYGRSIGTTSPLHGYGKDMARQAYKYKVDPRLCAAVSVLESSGGTICIKPHNAWGWGAADSDPAGLAYSWSSWEEAIEAWTRGVAESDAGMGEAPSVAALGDIYASSPTWASRVVNFMRGVSNCL